MHYHIRFQRFTKCSHGWQYNSQVNCKAHGKCVDVRWFRSSTGVADDQDWTEDCRLRSWPPVKVGGSGIIKKSPFYSQATPGQGNDNIKSWRTFTVARPWVSSHENLMPFCPSPAARLPCWRPTAVDVVITNSAAFSIVTISGMGLVRISSWYPSFNGSHFGLPPSEMHRMNGLPPKTVWTMTYSHRPHCWNRPIAQWRHASCKNTRPFLDQICVNIQVDWPVKVAKQAPGCKAERVFFPDTMAATTTTEEHKE